MTNRLSTSSGMCSIRSFDISNVLSNTVSFDCCCCLVGTGVLLRSTAFVSPSLSSVSSSSSSSGLTIVPCRPLLHETPSFLMFSGELELEREEEEEVEGVWS